MPKKHGNPIINLSDKNDPRVPAILKEMAKSAKRKPRRSERMQIIDLSKALGPCNTHYNEEMVLYDTCRWARYDSHTSEGRMQAEAMYVHEINQMRKKEGLPKLTYEQERQVASTLVVGQR